MAIEEMQRSFVIPLGLVLACAFAVYQMLNMFLTPIMWASLIGTILFPMKRLISAELNNWLKNLDEMDRPLIIGLALLPLQSLMFWANYIYEIAFSFTGICIGIGYTFLIIFLYTVAFGAWIYSFELENINKKLARVLSVPIWFLLVSHFSNLFGPLRVIIFSICFVLLAFISAGIIGADEEISEDIDETNKTEEINENLKAKEALAEEVNTAIQFEQFNKSLSSDNHLRIITCLCALLFIVNHDSLLFIFVIIPFALAVFVDLGNRLGLKEYFWLLLLIIQQQLSNKLDKFVHVVVAGPLRKFIHLLFTSDRMFISSLMSRVDLIASLAVMGALAVGSVLFLLFTLVQLHSEGLHLVKLGGNVLSSNPDWLRYTFMNYTTRDGKEHLDLDIYMEQAYQHGRSWLAANIRSLASPKDTARADQLEEQAKLLIDNLYHLWEERGGQQIYSNNETFSQNEEEEERIDENNNKIVEKKSFNSHQHTSWFKQIFDNANLIVWRRELQAITQSIWHILAANISLLTTALFAALSALLGFGSELLNGLIECIVFLTTVYYLLANSYSRWLPLQLLSDCTAAFQVFRSEDLTSGVGVDVAKAAERAINGVFLLSTKMAIFYGLYTYFIHSLFTLNVVFIPSMLAAILAAVPIFPPYIVGLFGVVELWLVRGEPIAAIVFACGSIAPLFFADPAFYREVKGSHPYATGLAVVGGIYWLGLQGAVIGPILLCLLLALFNVYAEFASNNTIAI
uniref:Transmembrane protein n=1 Tax=Meloidogyne javanica TaxID=6303 RepID=A0A915M9D0_MELJA